MAVQGLGLTKGKSSPLNENEGGEGVILGLLLGILLALVLVFRHINMLVTKMQHCLNLQHVLRASVRTDIEKNLGCLRNGVHYGL